MSHSNHSITRSSLISRSTSTLQDPFILNSDTIDTAFNWWSTDSVSITRSDIQVGLLLTNQSSTTKEQCKLLGGKESMTRTQLHELLEGVVVDKSMFMRVYQLLEVFDSEGGVVSSDTIRVWVEKLGGGLDGLEEEGRRGMDEKTLVDAFDKSRTGVIRFEDFKKMTVERSGSSDKQGQGQKK